MIDQNRDGLIDVKDLQAIYAQIGKQIIQYRNSESECIY